MNETMLVILQLIGGGALLTWGADGFVKAASALALRSGISPVIIGLTVVAFGTSAPELAVNITAALRGSTELAMGNVVGSNIFNLAFIMGTCGLILPLAVSDQLRRLDIPIMAGVSVLVWLLALDQRISQVEAGLLALGILGYVVLQIRIALTQRHVHEVLHDLPEVQGSALKDVAFMILGLILLLVGGKLFVDGAVLGARLLGWSESVIGLTIIAAGTSLPEVATSVIATLRGEREIAIGNVIGSNIFNLLCVVGFTGLFKPIGLNSHLVGVDLPVMLGITLVCLPVALWRRRIDRVFGAALLLSWCGYTWYLITHAAV
jgi:cation:H+ antiporter